MADPTEHLPPKLLTLQARLLLAIDHSEEPMTYDAYAETLGAHRRSVQRAVNEMVAAGWLTAKREPHHITLTINRAGLTRNGRSVGEWLDAINQATKPPRPQQHG